MPSEHRKYKCNQVHHQDRASRARFLQLHILNNSKNMTRVIHTSTWGALHHVLMQMQKNISPQSILVHTNDLFHRRLNSHEHYIKTTPITNTWNRRLKSDDPTKIRLTSLTHPQSHLGLCLEGNLMQAIKYASLNI